MRNVEEIEAAVKSLSGQELKEFRSWFARYDGKNWDDQIESDALGGKLDSMAKEAVAEYETGKAREL